MMARGEAVKRFEDTVPNDSLKCGINVQSDWPNAECSRHGITEEQIEHGCPVLYGGLFLTYWTPFLHLAMDRGWYLHE